MNVNWQFKLIYLIMLKDEQYSLNKLPHSNCKISLGAWTFHNIIKIFAFFKANSRIQISHQVAA